MIAGITGKPMEYTVSETNRIGDHICYISDLSKMREHYPNWDITIGLEQTFNEICESWVQRQGESSSVPELA